MEPQFTIGDRKIGAGAPCFVVAEISGNHHQKFNEAADLVRAAAASGADAVKLQTYTPDTITLNSDREWFRVGGEESPDLWKGKTLYQLYQEAYTPWEWQPELKKLADGLSIILFSTPFDESAVDFLEKMHVPCYKIASYEATDFVLLRRVAQTGKPVIISLGHASEDDASFALKALRDNGAKDIAALHCVTGYSDQPRLEDINLRTIRDISGRFNVVGGFSDNNAGIEIPVMAAASGAFIIEKHMILNRESGGPDAKFSVEPQEFKEMVARIRALENGSRREHVPEAALGKAHYGPNNAAEEYNKRWRRSLFVGKEMKKGDRFTQENVRDVRPAFGLETKFYDEVMGKRATRDIAAATPLDWSMIG
ncbi:MAG: pseudaminic acid synthase [Patescibacteria group bacterium]|nr:pseudaminic acid synthase [Patescibacteria group bacterium]